MAIALFFTPAGMTAKLYDEVLRRVDDQPPGRIHHVCLGRPENLRVVEVWESEEAFNAFRETVMAAFREAGVDVGRPHIGEVYNVLADGAPRQPAGT